MLCGRPMARDSTLPAERSPGKEQGFSMATGFLKQSQNELLNLNDKELDAIKRSLFNPYEKCPLDRDEIYSYIFGEGKLSGTEGGCL